MPSLNLFHTDPLTAAWLFALTLLCVAAIAVPLLRAIAAAILYALAAITGRRRLRIVADRFMPRIAHLIGGLVIGTASLAAPAMASGDATSLAGVDLDRDSGASRTAVAPATNAPGRTATPAPRPTPSSAHTTSEAETHTSPHGVAAVDAAAGNALYIVRTGDSLWDIAAAELDEPTNAEITEGWKAIWRANRAVIGDDPGLILPGQQLDLGILA